MAAYEHITGNVNIGNTKGDASHSRFANQYQVPGIENVPRSGGLTSDAHVLGLFYAMLLPVPFVFLMTRGLRTSHKLLFAAVFIMGAAGMVLSFSRSGWLSFAIGITIALGVIVFRWREPRALGIVFLVLIATSLLYPQIYSYVYMKLFESPSGLIDARIEMIQSAMDVWKKHFLFGYGPGNYIDALKDPDIKVVGRGDLIVHNLFMHIAAEKGLFGLLTYYGVIFFAIFRCFKYIMSEDLLVRGMSLAIMAALIAYVLDGVTDPLGREAEPYALLWIYIGIVMALGRIVDNKARTVSDGAAT